MYNKAKYGVQLYAQSTIRNLTVRENVFNRAQSLTTLTDRWPAEHFCMSVCERWTMYPCSFVDTVTVPVHSGVRQLLDHEPTCTSTCTVTSPEPHHPFVWFLTHVTMAVEKSYVLALENTNVLWAVKLDRIAMRICFSLYTYQLFSQHRNIRRDRLFSKRAPRVVRILIGTRFRGTLTFVPVRDIILRKGSV